MERYNRHIILDEIGQIGQDKIGEAKVLVVGAGGLGCPVLQYLVAAGVGTIGIIDFDVVEVSNLQRQVLFGKSVLGQNKAMAAKKRLEDLNIEIEINAYPEKLTRKNALELFAKYDLIVDGTDNFSTRYLINDAAVIKNKTFIYGGIYKFEGQVSVFNYKDGPTYRCVFPTPPKDGTIPNCSDIGVLGVLPGIIGIMQANEVLKIILGLGDVLSGKILYYNSLTNQSTIIKVNKAEDEIDNVLKLKENFKEMEIKDGCNSVFKTISIYDALNRMNVQLIDVRENGEWPVINDERVTLIPMSNIRNDIGKIQPGKEIMVFCKMGIRAEMAIDFFRKHDIGRCFKIVEGAEEIMGVLSKSTIESDNVE